MQRSYVPKGSVICRAIILARRPLSGRGWRSRPGKDAKEIAGRWRNAPAGPAKPGGRSQSDRRALARLPATHGGRFERGARDRPVSASYALLLVQAFDQSGRFDDPVSLLENGPPQLRSGPLVRLWLALSARSPAAKSGPRQSSLRSACWVQSGRCRPRDEIGPAASRRNLPIASSRCRANTASPRTDRASHCPRRV
jgi:hypothetical protein